MRFPSSPLHHRDVEICHNLRPSGRGDGLEAVGKPVPLRLKTLLRDARLLPGGRIIGPDGREYLFLEYGGVLLCYDGENLTALPEAPGCPCGIIRSGDRYLVLMGDEEAMMWLFVNDDGEWTWRSAAAMPEPLAIVRKDEGRLSAKIDGCTLRGSYSSRSSRLTEADEGTVANLLRDAYCSIGYAANARMLFFQPVIVRYCLFDRQRRVLYTSAPVMVSSSVGQQLLSVDLSLSGNGFSTVGEQTVSVEAFSVMLKPCAPLGEEWHDVVGDVCIMATPQLHPYDGGGYAPYRFGDFTATEGTLRAHIPGVNDAVATQGGYGSRLRSLVEDVLAGLDVCVRSIGTARFNPVKGVWNGIEYPFYSPILVTEREIELLDELIDESREALASIASRGRVADTLSASHWLCAGAGDEDGDCIAYTDVAAKRFKGWLPCEFAVETAESDPDVPDTAAVASKVTFADGSSCVRSGIVRGFSIGAVSPLLTYPSADAVKLELFYDNRYLSVPLRPDPSGRFAYWLSETGAPVKMQPDMPAFILPTESPRSLPFPGMVAVASASDPLRVVAVADTSEGKPVALRAAPSSAGGWDAGSARFYLFGSGGTHALTVNSARTRLTVRRIDSRPVGSGDAVCELGESSIALLAGEDLVKISGQKVTTLRPFTGARSLGWNARRGELTCFHSPDHPCPENFSLIEGNVVTPLFPDAVVTDSQGRLLYSRSVPQPRSLLSVAGEVVGIDADGQLYDFCRESDEESVDVYYRASIAAKSGTTTAKLSGGSIGCRNSAFAAGRYDFELPLFGNVETGRIEIRGDNGAGTLRSDLLTGIELRGEISHLPPLRVLSPHRHNFILNLHLRAKSLFLGPRA